MMILMVVVVVVGVGEKKVRRKEYLVFAVAVEREGYNCWVCSLLLSET